MAAPLTKPTKHDQHDRSNERSYSIIFFSCFCVTLLGSQIVLIYNVYTLTAEISKLDHWMRYIIENLNYTSSLNFGTTFSEDTYRSTQVSDFCAKDRAWFVRLYGKNPRA